MSPKNEYSYRSYRGTTCLNFSIQLKNRSTALRFLNNSGSNQNGLPSFGVFPCTVTALAFTATVILPYTAFGQVIFLFFLLKAAHMGVILGLDGVFFVCTELVKALHYRYAA
jgi:hypothetical protein